MSLYIISTSNIIINIIRMLSKKQRQNAEDFVYSLKQGFISAFPFSSLLLPEL